MPSGASWQASPRLVKAVSARCAPPAAAAPAPSLKMGKDFSTEIWSLPNPSSNQRSCTMRSYIKLRLLIFVSGQMCAWQPCRIPPHVRCCSAVPITPAYSHLTERCGVNISHLQQEAAQLCTLLTCQPGSAEPLLNAAVPCAGC